MATWAQDEWVRCPPGELLRLADRLRQARRLRWLAVGVTAAVVGTALAVGATWLGGTLRSQDSPGHAAPCSGTPASGCHETPP
jgi:hypothetical protein